MLEPKNELGVIVEFAERARQHGFTITKIEATFPDALIEKEGKLYRAEFEFASSSFDQHNHDIRDCDLIICWLNDASELLLPVLDLSNPDWMNTPLILPNDLERDAYYWRRRALKAEKALQTKEVKTIPAPIRTSGGTIGFGTKRDYVLWLHEQQPELTQAEVAERVGCAPSTVSRAWSKNGDNQ